MVADMVVNTEVDMVADMIYRYGGGHGDHNTFEFLFCQCLGVLSVEIT